MALVDIAMGFWYGVECVHMQVRVVAAVSDGLTIYPLAVEVQSSGV